MGTNIFLNQHYVGLDKIQMIFKCHSKCFPKFAQWNSFVCPGSPTCWVYYFSETYLYYLAFLMTSLLSEIFAGTEVIFVNQANPRIFQMLGNSFLQMKSVSVVAVFLCVYGVYVGLLRRVRVVGRGLIFRWKEKILNKKLIFAR